MVDTIEHRDRVERAWPIPGCMKSLRRMAAILGWRSVDMSLFFNTMSYNKFDICDAFVGLLEILRAPVFCVVHLVTLR